jgi:hypothetical protein
LRAISRDNACPTKPCILEVIIHLRGHSLINEEWSNAMKKAAKWVTLLKSCVYHAGSTSIFRRSRRRLIAGCVALLGGLLLAGSPAQAVTLEGDDILVTDSGANRLIRVDGTTGVRSVISDFSNPAQGPVLFPNATLNSLSVAVGHGQIFVTGPYVGILLVDARTGHRTLVSDWHQGRDGSFGLGAAIDALGRVYVNDEGAFVVPAVVRVAPRTDTRVTVTTLWDVSQGGGDFRFCGITDLALEPHKWNPKHSGEPILIGVNGLCGKLGMYRVNPVTGYRTLLSDFANAAQGAVVDFSSSGGLAVEQSGAILANSGGSSPRNLLLRIDPISGKRTVASDFDNPAQGPLGATLAGIAVQDCGLVMVGAPDPATGRNNLIRVDPRTGKRILFSNSANPGQGPAFNRIAYLAVVPHNAGFFAAPPAGSFSSPFGPAK